MADPIITSVSKEYATHSESILSHEITFEQTKRSFSTAEFTCSATHKIRGELTADLDFYIFKKLTDGTLIPVFYSQLNPQDKRIASDIPNEDKVFEENSFKIIIEDIDPNENNINLVFKVLSDNTKFNYEWERQLHFSTFITKPIMEGELTVSSDSVPVSTSLIPYFTKKIKLEWTAATLFVDSTNSSNGYILSYSFDSGLSWSDIILTNLSVNAGKVNYSFDVDSIPSYSSILFKVACFNDLGIKSNEILCRKTLNKTEFVPVKNIKVTSIDVNDEEQADIINYNTKKIKIQFDPASCIDKNANKQSGLNFYYNILLPEGKYSLPIRLGQEPKTEYEIGPNKTSLLINIVDTLEEAVSSTELYIVKSDIEEYMGENISQKVSFIIKAILHNGEETETRNKEASFIINLSNSNLIGASNLEIHKDTMSSAFLSIQGVSYLIPDKSKTIKLTWDKGYNVANENELVYYDIYVGIDDIYYFENTTINTSYDLRLNKVDKATKVSFYLVTRTKYSSTRSRIESAPSQEVHYYNGPVLNQIEIKRYKNTCNVRFSLDIDTSIKNFRLDNISLSINNNVENSITGLPQTGAAACLEEINCLISNLEPTSSYILYLSYNDTTGLNENSIEEEFNIPAATPIMEITPNCITMGGAELDSDYILNVKGNVNIDGVVTTKHYEINGLLDDINLMKTEGTYSCTAENAELIKAHIPYVGNFALIVKSGLVPLHFLIYTDNNGDNNIYMRTCVNEIWSEWVLLHQKSIENS